jgi:hypothetical protein
MTFDDVDPFEMEPRDPHELDDHVADELLAGRGRELDPQLADVLGDVRVAFRSQMPPVGTELDTVLNGEGFERAPTRRTAHMRTAMARRLAAATTLALVATGGLAVAGALPAPAQDAAERAASAVGVDLPHGKSGDPHGHKGEHGKSGVHGRSGDHPGSSDPTTAGSTDATDDPSPDSAAPHDNHGAEVSAVAHDHSVTGCEHGRAVSAIASGTTNDKPCPTTSSTVPTTETTAPEGTDEGQGPPPTHPEHPNTPASPPGKPADPGSGPPASTPGATHPTAEGHAVNG